MKQVTIVSLNRTLEELKHSSNLVGSDRSLNRTLEELKLERDI